VKAYRRFRKDIWGILGAGEDILENMDRTVVTGINEN